jgi:hypothetical protein
MQIGTGGYEDDRIRKSDCLQTQLQVSPHLCICNEGEMQNRCYAMLALFGLI